jgi:eukaryotic-like serine/threonine-protein kinase
LALRTGTRITGRFEITGALGAGSMGEVYQAHDLKLHRDVAVKLLSTSLAASEENLLRFEREARAASGLNHPHICTIYDVGQAPEADNRPYLVMELLRGTTLAEMLASGPIPVPVAVGVAVQVADALDAAHSAGIIHRDIKPANIFVTTRGDAKLLDFGLAAIADTESDATDSATGSPRKAHVTNPGAAVGTVLYMSPEQALGDPLDGRTDIFSLGLVLYQMLTGKHPFEAKSITAIVDGILHATPPGLDPKTPSPIAADLKRLIARMLEKQRDLRPSTAADVSVYLRAIQSGSMAGREYAAVRSDSAVMTGGLLASQTFERPSAGAPQIAAPLPAPVAKPGRRRLVLSSAVAAGLLLLVFGVYMLAKYRTRPVTVVLSREPVLLADFANTTGEAVFDGALKNALEIQLQQSPYLNVVPASQVRSWLQLMQRSPTDRITTAVAHDLCQRFGVKAILLGSIAPLDSAYVIGIEAQACRTGQVVARQQVQASAKTDVLASVGAAAAQIREKLGESVGSIERYNVPVRDATTASLEALKAYSVGVETRIKTGDVQAISFFEHALELDPNFALAAARLASIYMNLHDLAAAQKFMEQAFRRSDSLSEPERLFVKANYHYIVTGRLDESVGAYRLWINTYPHDWIPYSNLSTTYERLGQLEEALQEARAAVRLAPDAAPPYLQLARTLLVLERFDESKRVLEDATARGLDTSFSRALLFDIAFVGDDPKGMEQHLNTAMPRADGYLVVTEAARAALASGQVEASRALYAQAVAGAQAAHATDFAGALVAEQALVDTLVGYPTVAREELQTALSIGSGSGTMWAAALAAALGGQAAQAAQLAEKYQQLTPPSPDVVNALAPALQAAIALANNDSRRSVDLLKATLPYDRVIDPAVGYVHGLALAASGDRARAAAQFRSVADHRGVQPASPLHVLARLQLARTLRDAKDDAEARRAYDDFTAAWSNADKRQPLLMAADRERAALGPAPPSDRQ